jgi:hypothetical protein
MVDRVGDHVEEHRGRGHRHDLPVGEAHVAWSRELVRRERRRGVHVPVIEGLELAIEILERGQHRTLRGLVTVRNPLEVGLEDPPDDVDVIEGAHDQVRAPL